MFINSLVFYMKLRFAIHSFNFPTTATAIDISGKLITSFTGTLSLQFDYLRNLIILKRAVKVNFI